MTSHRNRTHGHRKIRRAEWQATAPIDTKGSSLASPAMSLLIGTVLGWLVVALGEPVADIFNPPAVHGVITASMLLCVAIGTRLPHRLARWLALLTWNRRRNQRTGHSPESASADMQLLMMVLGAVAMLTGLAIAAFPLLVRYAGWCYRIAVDRFFWLPYTYALLVAGITCVATIAPLALTGFLLTCVNQMGRQNHAASPATLPWVLLGCGTGVALFASTGTLAVKWELLVIVAAVPVLVVAIGAVRFSKRFAPANATPPPSPTLPERAPLHPVFARLADIVFTATASCLVMLWYRCMLDGTRSPLGSAELPVVLLWAAALGMGWGAGSLLSMANWRPGLGLTCVAAGCVNFATVVLITSIDRLSGSTADIVATALPCLAISTIAAAVARLRNTILTGSTRRNTTESLMLSETAWVSACAMMVLAVIDPDLDRLYWVITSIAIGLSAVGLFVIVQEPPHHATRRNIRLTAAVCSLALMVLLWPSTVQRWKNVSTDAPPTSTSSRQPNGDVANGHSTIDREPQSAAEIAAPPNRFHVPGTSPIDPPSNATMGDRPKKTSRNATPAAFCLSCSTPSSLLGRHPISLLP